MTKFDPGSAGALTTLGRSSGSASLILSSLADGARRGCALTKGIESLAGVRLAPGTLYEALSRLESRLTATSAAALSTYLEQQRQVTEIRLRRLTGAWSQA